MIHHTDSTRKPWPRAVEWIVLSSAGWMRAACITNTTLRMATTMWSGNAAAVAYALSLLASVVVIALLQWIVVRLITPSLGRWLFASLVAMTLAAVVPMPLKLLDWHIGASRLQWDELLYGLAFGALLGLGQGVALWGRSGRLAVWTVGSALGWAIATAAASALPLPGGDVEASWLSPAITGAIASIGTGIAVGLCLRSAPMPRPDPVISTR